MKILTVPMYTAAVILIGLGSGWSPAQADEDGIGLYGTVEGTVMVAHPGVLGRPVKVQEPVLFQDMIETQNESRTKALFDDDSILTVGENSKVQITEYIYNPNQNIRSAVVHLLEGRLRALVAKAFKGPGSKFEIHTPTAVAAARGTYFVVWSEEGKSGMVNIGEEGKVDFTAAGKTVTVDPGHYSVALPGQPPSQPAPYQPVQDQSAKSGGATTKTEDTKQSSVVLAKVEEENDDDKKTKNRKSRDKAGDHMTWLHKAVADTKVKDRPRFEKPMDVLRALRHDAGAATRVTAKLGSEQQSGRLRHDRKPNGVNDNNGNGVVNGSGQSSEENENTSNGNNAANGNAANGNTGDNGRGKGQGGNDGNGIGAAKVGELPSDKGNGDGPKGDKGQGGGDGSGNANANGNRNGNGNSNINGNGNGDGPKDRGRGDGNSDGPKDRNRGGDGSKVASSNFLGSSLGNIGSGVLPSPSTVSPVTSPSVAPAIAPPAASPVMAPPVAAASPMIGAPVTPTVPVVPVTPPAVITGAANAFGKYGNSADNGNRGNGGGNGHGKTK